MQEYLDKTTGLNARTKGERMTAYVQKMMKDLVKAHKVYPPSNILNYPKQSCRSIVEACCAFVLVQE